MRRETIKAHFAFCIPATFGLWALASSSGCAPDNPSCGTLLVWNAVAETCECPVAGASLVCPPRENCRCEILPVDGGPAADAQTGDAEPRPVDGAAPDATLTCGSECTWGCADGVCDPPIAVAAGLGRACALRASGRVFCWGGTVGDGTSMSRSRPTAVRGIGLASAISLGDSHACMLVDGTVLCWGDNEQGQLGDGGTTGRLTPVPALGLTSASALSTGSHHTCAMQDGRVLCWGSHISGALGDGSTVIRSTPSAVPELSDVTALSCAGTSCCVRRGEDVLCWGSPFPSSRPTVVDVEAESFALGDRHACFIADGSIRCMGSNTNGQLGDGTTTDRGSWAAASLADAVQGAGGNVHTCARTGSGSVWCWGRSHRGQVGNGLTIDQRTPVQVLTDATAVAVGHVMSCAVLMGGRVACWGMNTSGEVGDGTMVDALVPTDVLPPL